MRRTHHASPLPPDAKGREDIIGPPANGPVVTALGILALERLHARSGLTAASLLAGIWILISPFILAAKFPITASMYWSNIWAGAVIIVAGLGALTARARRRGVSRGMT